MLPNNLLSVASIICFSLPILVVVYYRLYRHLSVVALVLYCGLKLFHSSMGDVTLPAQNLADSSELFFRFLELPLLLSALLLFCSAGRQQEGMQALVLLFVIYEIFVLLFVDYSPLVGLYIALPGMVLVVLHSTFLFQQQLRFTLAHKKNGGRLMILGAISLSSGSYLAGIILGKSNDTFLHTLNIFILNLSAVIIGFGLYILRHRIKGLQDLKVTRREMEMLFGG